MHNVYLLACRKNGTHYLGVTNDLVRRVYQHKKKLTPGFTSRARKKSRSGAVRGKSH